MNRIIRFLIFLSPAVIITSCMLDDFMPDTEAQFIRFFGTGFTSRAIDFEILSNNEIYVLGNEFIRNNQDSTAYYVIRLNADGNLIWSNTKNFGKGFALATDIAIDAEENAYLTVNTRPRNISNTTIILEKIDQSGNRLWQYQDDSTLTYANRANQIFFDNDLNRCIVVGFTNRNGSNDLMIRVHDPVTGALISEFIRASDVNTSGNKIIKARNFGVDSYFVIGNTLEQTENSQQQNILIAQFSMDLIPLDNLIIPSQTQEEVIESYFSINNSLNIIGTSLEENGARTFLYFVQKSRDSIHVQNKIEYNYANFTRGMAINESNSGFIMTAKGISETSTGNKDILLLKSQLNGTQLWDQPMRIRGNGNDEVARIKIVDGYVYILGTVDQQNESQMIALSKIRY